MPRQLVLFGSGETTPAMVTFHRELFARHGALDPSTAVMLDTTFGFQTNADDLTARLQAYFEESAGTTIGAVRLRSSSESAATVAAALDAVASASWVFAGPGSPTYTARNWLAVGMERAFVRVLEQGTLVAASAAAMTLGSHVMPVYEMYRVGEEPHWKSGLDVIGAALGVKAAVVAHFDNTEGGNHDTRYCFAGQERFERLVGQLPHDTGVIGVDEHTAVLIDLDAGNVSVAGRGSLTLLSPGGAATVVVSSGEQITLDALRSAFTPAEVGTAADDDVNVDEAISRIEQLLDGREYAAAVELLLDLDSQGVDHLLLRPLVVRMGRIAAVDAAEHDLLGELFKLVIELRASARADKRWADADVIRDRLAQLGVTLNDGPDGTSWSRA